MSNRLSRLFLVFACLAPLLTNGIEMDAEFDDPEKAALYERLNEEVRCLVCQNQTIGDSNAPLAADLRREVREQVDAGMSEAEIKTFLTDRYGDFVLYKPRYDGPALLLWIAPGVLLLVGLFMLIRTLRRRASLELSDATEDEA
ncbi:MAG: cytochrome c-type biogenesis protein CcmH [Gammaproteobacteria bacterium]|nr:cytochrome c-type biogenesis protein CcmH [Gammaproteobacteria bacterium]